MKATRIQLFSFSTAPMRAFHMTWLAFFVCFFAWFGMAPLMPLVREEFGLSKTQMGDLLIASVAATILGRLIIGWACDRYGPRRVYAALLAFGALPVMGIGLSTGYASFLLFRLAISLVGASFVITQYHTAAMFAPNCVGMANATTAGWGNLGGGIAQIAMPLIVTLLMALGVSSPASWRLAMLLPGALMLLLSVLYLRFTQDGPEGAVPAAKASGKGAFLEAARDPRVWALFVGYGACFGVEITLHNMAAVYFHDRFGLDLKLCGLLAGSFGVLALFARSLGGWLSDRTARRVGLRGRSLLLGSLLLGEGVLLLFFSKAAALPLAVVLLLVFGLFVHMSAGATYAVVPFVRRHAVGSVAGIVGAGGNVGAVAAGLLFRTDALTPDAALGWLGAAVIVSSGLAMLVRFTEAPAPAPELPAAVEGAVARIGG